LCFKLCSKSFHFFGEFQISILMSLQLQYYQWFSDCACQRNLKSFSILLSYLSTSCEFCKVKYQKALSHQNFLNFWSLMASKWYLLHFWSDQSMKDHGMFRCIIRQFPPEFIWWFKKHEGPLKSFQWQSLNEWNLKQNNQALFSQSHIHLSSFSHQIFKILLLSLLKF